MKQSFVQTWKSSTQPRKQRKYRYNAPLHTAGTFLNVHLSPELRKKYGMRSLRVRKGDTVKVVRGQHKGKSGKVDRVSTAYSRVYVSGIDLVRKDGTKTLIPLNPTNLSLISVVTTDKKRIPQKKEDSK
ncbi:MAG: 50S ribosomal protein L24 [Candidatus Woesearchaeota archaeon]